jgi:repressor LexA
VEADGDLVKAGQARRGVSGNVVRGGIASPRVVQVPLLGRIAAGQPISVPDEIGDFAPFGDDTVEVAASMLEDTDGLYALEVRGNSMIDALINDGDIVVMKHQNHAETGEMVAVLLVEENETTLKRFYLEGDRVRLQPANPTMEPIYAPAADVEVQGKVMMVIRKID